MISNKLTKLFNRKSTDLLNIFFTAGYPKLEDTTTILNELEKSGVDLIEIGIPFSDPLADGPTIQESSKIALENGMSIEVLFNQLETSKHDVPVLLMGYFNPVMQYGIEHFCKRCKDVGVDGLIIPDLPLEVYASQYKHLFEKYDLCNVFLVTPQTSTNRIKEIDEFSNGFIYAVSSASTTGTKSNFDDASEYLNKLKSLNLKSPILTGFNIKTRENYLAACKHVNGAIIGSEFIRQISNPKSSLQDTVKDFVSSIKND
ncbi:tryptophan synthase alpha chain [Nonlabens sp. MIC269]|uniref:tryptophan synthase subunit alpha n=1 Tax=Nonlabens sp. MIC269 TaxID=1476901 RepID=UPI00071F2464|nr:tryptophan synthase subunit alpha [Nonlabens sp. MIC269]ALM20512.1 tryptophan synthase alpha chain [Nonlabens sp. MIC269]